MQKSERKAFKALTKKNTFINRDILVFDDPPLPNESRSHGRGVDFEQEVCSLPPLPSFCPFLSTTYLPCHESNLALRPFGGRSFPRIMPLDKCISTSCSRWSPLSPCRDHQVMCVRYDERGGEVEKSMQALNLTELGADILWDVSIPPTLPLPKAFLIVHDSLDSREILRTKSKSCNGRGRPPQSPPSSPAVLGNAPYQLQSPEAALIPKLQQVAHTLCYARTRTHDRAGNTRFPEIEGPMLTRARKVIISQWAMLH